MQFSRKKGSFATLGEIMTAWKKKKKTYFLSEVVQCGWDIQDIAGDDDGVTIGI
jgi:hypothetical protein